MDQNIACTKNWPSGSSRVFHYVVSDLNERLFPETSFILVSFKGAVFPSFKDFIFSLLVNPKNTMVDIVNRVKITFFIVYSFKIVLKFHL